MDKWKRFLNLELNQQQSSKCTLSNFQVHIMSLGLLCPNGSINCLQPAAIAKSGQCSDVTGFP